MVHFICDCCAKEIDTEHELRYVVKMEVYAALDLTEDDLNDDCDHLEELQDILEREADASSDQIGDDVYQTIRMDLCRECRDRFVRNPLGQPNHKQFHFSNN